MTTAEEFAGPLRKVGAAGLTVADLTRSGAPVRGSEPANPCHHCGADATTQWSRRATDDEHEQHWDAVEQNIRASNDGHEAAGYVADRSDSVTKAVFGCDEHPDPAPGAMHEADCGGHGACGCGGTA